MPIDFMRNIINKTGFILEDITVSKKVIWIRSKNREQEINVNLHICDLIMK